MIVQELFEQEKIDLDFIEEMEDLSAYWQTCVNFVTENWRRRVDGLSAKQGAWLTKILDDCVEKRIEGKRGH
jgi:undecaprenyl pyrophosphate synthase